jgi:hypothetical protein
MIRYDLQCSNGHEFDGWYRDSDAFAKLAKAGLLDCPRCGDSGIAKRLMAPAVVTSPSAPRALRPESRPVAEAPPMAVAEPAPGSQAVAGPMPAELKAALQRLRAEVEKRCDYVGNGFAEEARRMHRGESNRVGIYGETSEAEAEALRDEGVGIARIPWVPRADG